MRTWLTLNYDILDLSELEWINSVKYNSLLIDRESLSIESSLDYDLITAELTTVSPILDYSLLNLENIKLTNLVVKYAYFILSKWLRCVDSLNVELNLTMSYWTVLSLSAYEEVLTKVSLVDSIGTYDITINANFITSLSFLVKVDIRVVVNVVNC